jgi:hypothetical protein
MPQDWVWERLGTQDPDCPFPGEWEEAHLHWLRKASLVATAWSRAREIGEKIRNDFLFDCLNHENKKKRILLEKVLILEILLQEIQVKIFQRIRCEEKNFCCAVLSRWTLFGTWMLQGPSGQEIQPEDWKGILVWFGLVPRRAFSGQVFYVNGWDKSSLPTWILFFNRKVRNRLLNKE